MVSGMMYEPDEQGVIMRLEHHLVGGYVRYISPLYYYIIITHTKHTLVSSEMFKISRIDPSVLYTNVNINYHAVYKILMFYMHEQLSWATH